MRKLFKIIVLLVLLIVLIFALGIGILLFFTDPNKMKSVLVEEVKTRSGYQLTINGRLSWSFYPLFGMKAEQLSLSKSDKSPPFVYMKEVRFATEFSQLWSRNDKFEGNISVGDITLFNAQMHQLSTNVHWENKILTLQNIKANTYSGTLTGMAQVSQFSKAPHFEWYIDLNHIQLATLLRDMLGPDSKLRLSGLGQMKLIATTTGKEREDFYNHLNGTLAFSLLNGAIEGVDLNYFIESANALLNKQAFPSSTSQNQTDFTSLTGTAKIKDGLASTEDILLSSSNFQAKSQGDINLLSEALRFQLQVNPLLTIKFPVEIPVVLEGNLKHPDVRLDTVELEKFLAKQEIEKLKVKAQEQIEKHIPGKIGDLLQNLIR